MPRSDIITEPQCSYVTVFPQKKLYKSTVKELATGFHFQMLMHKTCFKRESPFLRRKLQHTSHLLHSPSLTKCLEDLLRVWFFMTALMVIRNCIKLMSHYFILQVWIQWFLQKWLWILVTKTTNTSLHLHLPLYKSHLLLCWHYHKNIQHKNFS